MSTTTRKCHRSCFYCEVDLTRHEHDHAPVPQSAGGTAIVPACLPCHHLKDRMTVAGWPVLMLWAATSELVDRGVHIGSLGDWPTCWDSLSREARLLWAKAARLAAQDERPRHDSNAQPDG